MPSVSFRETSPRSICLVRLSAIGDVVQAVPLVRALQRGLPGTRLTWVVGSVEAGLVGDLAGVEVVPVSKGRPWTMLRHVRRRLYGRHFDVLLQPQAALRASLTAQGVRAGVRVGFDRRRARDGQGLFVNHHVAPHPRAHVLEGFLDFARAVGVEPGPLEWGIPIPDSERAWAAQQAPASGPLVVINPCSSVRPNNWRNWRVANYAAVAEHAVAEHGARVVLTGGPDPGEHAFCEAVRGAMTGDAVNLAGATSLKGLLALLAAADVLVAPDTGPAHMASAVGTPVIGLYATSNPARTGPYRSQEWVVNRYPEALRRFAGREVEEVRWGRRVRDPRAMDLIRPGDVTARLDRLFAGEGPPHQEASASL